MNIRTWKPIAGGILSIVAGVIHFIGWLGISLVFPATSSQFGYNVPNAVLFLIIPLVILAIVAIAGGIFALMRKAWGLALAGAICAIFSPLTWFLGVIATIFIALSKDEFDRPVSPLPPSPPPAPPIPPSI